MAITWAGTAWTATTGYVIGDRVVNGGNVYRCTVAGTSGNTGGPTGTGSAITDGNCTWAYLGANGGAVIDVAAELATLTAGQQRSILDMVDRQVADAEFLGSYFDDGARYLAAHLGAVSKLKGKGPVTAEAVGSVSRSYASLLQFGPLGTTAYGVEFERLVRLTGASLGEVF